MSRRARGIPLQLGQPDIGTHLATLLARNGLYHDIVSFILHNHVGYNEIHVHRNSIGHPVMISCVNSGYAGGRHQLLHTDQLFIAAAAAAREQ